jgi:hypothetical protein
MRDGLADHGAMLSAEKPSRPRAETINKIYWRAPDKPVADRFSRFLLAEMTWEF